jgi:hypothetical protein
MEVTVNKVLDAKGLACPMPIVKTKKEIGRPDLAGKAEDWVLTLYL